MLCLYINRITLAGMMEMSKAGEDPGGCLIQITVQAFSRETMVLRFRVWAGNVLFIL